MDFWPAAALSGGRDGGPGSDLNLLHDPLLIDLDDKTLQASGRAGLQARNRL